MEFVASFTADPSIHVVLVPTVQAFYPKLLAHKDEIESVTRKTFQYGATERHKLDVYYPVGSAAGEKVPVLFFEYGGGFNTGNRVQPAPLDLIYRNVGAFFANQGFFTVIADYRLVPPARYPEPAEDIGQAVAWFVTNGAEIGKDSATQPDTEKIFLMGNSAGAAHLVSLVASPAILSQDTRNRLRGIILLGGAYSYPTDDSSLGAHLEVLRQYFGTDEAIRQYEPLALVAKAEESVVKSLPPVLVLKDEWEPANIEKDHGLFVSALKARSVKVEEEVLKGHNHISPGVSLSSGDGEEWGKNVAEWIRKAAV
ncbi:hypothetical protein QCA50_017933 [Cerrena zonata]|uniref:Alpha/beta hydrolase fold-3 domain-containing protein n=1 Tax=Cerrena zonata TaxID=2478898 RepID=A0AAW0FC22_9APHY